jgi:mannose-6-phosphate isomerase
MVNIYTFEEGYVERMWGGTKLRRVLGKATPDDACIGEAWMISDHPQHESVVDSGPDQGRTLHDLLEENPERILGTQARLTEHGRFPLLLKLLDAGDKLSIQVHPDDDTARHLGEPDVGKTEMWHVLQADPGATLYCGMPPETTETGFSQAASCGECAALLTAFPAREGDSVFVPAGTVHAIGGGSLLAEIQQNSDLTYRIDDWGRVQDDGSPRELHMDRAIQAVQFGSTHRGKAHPLAYDASGATVTILAACRYFASEEVAVKGKFQRQNSGASCYLVLAKTGSLQLTSEGDTVTLSPGRAALVVGETDHFSLQGNGRALMYYVPDLNRNILEPLLDAGHTRGDIVALGGDEASSDLRVD